MIHLAIVMLALTISTSAFADRGRADGAACRKDLECASKKCGLKHGDWICMAKKTSPPPRSAPSPRSSPRNDDAAPEPAPPSPAEEARLCRNAETAWRRQGDDKLTPVLNRCSDSCDLGTTASCQTLERAARHTCTIVKCGGICELRRDSPSFQRAFKCNRTRR